MKFSKNVIKEAERLYKDSEFEYIVEAVKSGNAGALRFIQESNGFPYKFIENMVKKHGENAITEIKAHLNHQLDINEVYRDNYDELEIARTQNGGYISYSPAFVEKVKKVFPNNKYIIELAETNSMGLRRMIDEERSYMNVEGMLKIIQEKGDKGAMQEFQSRAARAKDINNLYKMCYDEYNDFVNSQSEPSGMGE